MNQLSADFLLIRYMVQYFHKDHENLKFYQ